MKVLSHREQLEYARMEHRLTPSGLHVYPVDTVRPALFEDAPKELVFDKAGVRRSPHVPAHQTSQIAPGRHLDHHAGRAPVTRAQFVQLLPAPFTDRLPVTLLHAGEARQGTLPDTVDNA